jgi:hypothetical protein
MKIFTTAKKPTKASRIVERDYIPDHRNQTRGKRMNRNWKPP